MAYRFVKKVSVAFLGREQYNPGLALFAACGLCHYEASELFEDAVMGMVGPDSRNY